MQNPFDYPDKVIACLLTDAFFLTC